MLIPPNTNRRPRLEMEFFQNVLHVFLHGARAASEYFSDLAIAFAGRDPFDDFELAFSQGTRSFGVRGRALVNSGCLAVPGGHGKIAFSRTQSLRPYA